MNHIIIIHGDKCYNLLFVFFLQISVATVKNQTTDNDSSLASFRSLRTLRALRPLRAISRWEGMKVNNSSTRKLTIQFSASHEYKLLLNIKVAFVREPNMLTKALSIQPKIQELSKQANVYYRNFFFQNLIRKLLNFQNANYSTPISRGISNGTGILGKKFAYIWV